MYLLKTLGTAFTLALAASAFFMLIVAPQLARASDLNTITAATYKLYSGSDGVCSTTFLKNDKDGAMFITAAHCIDNSKDAKNLDLSIRKQVLDPKNLRDVLSEEVFYVKPIRTLVKKDVAILQVRDKAKTLSIKGPDIATVEEANTLVTGDAVAAVGYPAASYLSVTNGTFVGKVAQVFPDLDQDTPMYQTTVPVAGGNSGGSLYAEFDTADGKGKTWKMIGTTTGMRRDNSIMTWFQTAETLNEVVKGYVNTEKFEPKPERPSQMGIDQR